MSEFEFIKKIIIDELQKNNIQVYKILLFGSRAIGIHNQQSDYDLLIVIDKNLDFNEKWKLILPIKRKLLLNNIPNDIILKSKKSFETDKEIINTITYVAEKEGIVL